MKGKVAVFSAPCTELEIREYPLPEVGPEDMLVKIRRTNICGSDLHMWRGHGPRLAPGLARVLGHEMTGEVYRLGRRGQRDCLGQPLREGDRIVYSYFVPCGACPVSYFSVFQTSVADREMFCDIVIDQLGRVVLVGFLIKDDGVFGSGIGGLVDLDIGCDGFGGINGFEPSNAHWGIPGFD